MIDITGTANYATYQAAKATYAATPTHENGDDLAKQLCVCIVEAGGNPGPLRIFDRPASTLR